MTSESKRSLMHGLAAGLAAAAFGAIAAFMTQAGFEIGPIKWAVLFILVGPYALFSAAFSFASIAIPGSLEFIYIVLAFIYWALIGSLAGWFISKVSRLVSILLIAVILAAHLWVAVEFDRSTKSIGKAVIEGLGRWAVRWGPVAETIIKEDSKNTGPAR